MTKRTTSSRGRQHRRAHRAAGANLAGLRICVVGPSPPGPDSPGAQTETLWRLLQREDAVVRRAYTDAARIRDLPLIGRWIHPPFQVLIVLWQLLRYVWRVDVIHVLAGSDWDFFLPIVPSLALGKALRRRVVASFLGSDATAFMSRHEGLMWSLLRRCDGIGVATRFTGEVFERYGLRTTVVPRILELERFPFQSRREWPPLILWARPLHPNANPAMAFRALAILRKTVPDARLLMVGQGPLLRQVKALAVELGITPAVSLRPSLPFHRMRQAVQTASVLWCTSSVDDLPLIVLETAATGTVIVSTDVGGVSELLHNGVDALLVAPNDHEALAAATNQVLSRPALAAGLAGNARLAVERYSWDSIRQDVARLYGLAAAPRVGDQDVDIDPTRVEFLRQELSERPPQPLRRRGWQTVDMEGKAELLQADPQEREQPAGKQERT